MKAGSHSNLSLLSKPAVYALVRKVLKSNQSLLYIYKKEMHFCIIVLIKISALLFFVHGTFVQISLNSDQVHGPNNI